MKLSPHTHQVQVAIYLQDRFLEKSYQNTLVHKNMCVVWCESIHDLQSAIVSCVYDAVLVDVSEHVQPLELIRELRRVVPDSAVVVISRESSPSDVIEAFRLGVVDYLLKPITPEGLVWAIERACLGARTTVNVALNLDFDVFRVAHQISLADSVQTMRAMALKSLCKMTGAAGGAHLVQAATMKATVELGNEREFKEGFQVFEKLHPGFMVNAFETERSIHPETWFEQQVGWIPLREAWMGGFFLWGTVAVTPELIARIEYLVRSLETSVDSYERFLTTKKMTYVDDVTELYNNRYLSVYLNGLVEAGSPFAVLFIDIDHFKRVNDTHGHLVGSSLLIQLSRRLKRALRPEDALFRYGGDEFIAVLNATPREEAVEIAQRLRTVVERSRFKNATGSLSITVSIGVALYPRDAKSAQRILAIADSCMYEGKRSGRNMVFSCRS